MPNKSFVGMLMNSHQHIGKWFVYKLVVMLRIKDVLKEIEQYAPLPLQESFDNAGVQVGDVNQPATGALLCLDVTEEVVHDESLQV